jgi:hygromycin-B 4-O-kinase
VHCDLVNRNVLVSQDSIAGVFDWGCSLYGDHLYDLAWLEFWAPWYPKLSIHYLRLEMERRWREGGYAPEDKEVRLMACYLHIGLSHLAYNAHLGDLAAVSQTAERMRQVVTVVSGEG